MATNYVLIDFENVHPRNLEVLKKHPFRVLVFVGANQGKIPFDLAEAMQALGDAARYIKITGTGKNALDFHIAYYIGELSAKDSNADCQWPSILTHVWPLILTHRTSFSWSFFASVDSSLLPA